VNRQTGIKKDQGTISLIFFCEENSISFKKLILFLPHSPLGGQSIFQPIKGIVRTVLLKLNKIRQEFAKRDDRV
jgi:hypothetical protein